MVSTFCKHFPHKLSTFRNSQRNVFSTCTYRIFLQCFPTGGHLSTGFFCVLIISVIFFLYPARIPSYNKSLESCIFCAITCENSNFIESSTFVCVCLIASAMFVSLQLSYSHCYNFARFQWKICAAMCKFLFKSMVLHTF